MSKLLLTICAFTAALTGFLAARQSTARFENETIATRGAWQTQTQQLATMQTDQTELAGGIRSLNQALEEARAATADSPWIALRSNRADLLAPNLRERLLAELDVNWRLSPDYIVVTKQTLRDLGLKAVQDGHVTELAGRVFAIRPEERGQAEAALQQAQQAFANWVVTHVERTEPGGGLVAQYALPGDPKVSESIREEFHAALSVALGQERADLLRPSAEDWMRSFGLFDCGDKPTAMTVTLYQAGDEQRMKLEIQNWLGRGSILSRDLTDNSDADFPRIFRFTFPNGWADLAQREGFELPPGSQVQ
jgi:hypothetical protein